MQDEQQSTKPATLDQVFQAITHWRENKNSYDMPGIPDKIWHMIFKLESQGHSGAQLRRMFSLNSSQYKKKQSELNATEQPTDENIKKNNSPAQANFSEVNVSENIMPLPSEINHTKQVIKKLKSTDNDVTSYLSNNTMVVECFRPDGGRLKIHTTCERFSEIFHNFFAGEIAP